MNARGAVAIARFVSGSLALVSCLVLLASPAFAGQGIIGVNVHRLECSGGDTLPSTLANDPNVDVLSYHTFGNTSTLATCVVNRVMGTSGYTPPLNPVPVKPEIISSDGGTWTNATASSWIDLIRPTTSTDPKLTEHYEHYEQFFGRCSCMDLSLGCVANTSSCNTFTYPTEGGVVSSASQLPQCSAGTTSTALRNKLGNRATALVPNGRLHRVTSPSPNPTGELRWQTNGEYITLMGYSWMGALTGVNFSIDGYLNALNNAGTNGINLTRVWAIEQWTAMQVDCPSVCCGATCFTSTCSAKGLTPFTGDLATPKLYNLDAPNPEFYSRLRQFAQKAADRGMVVQLSLFDKHGLINTPKPEGQWLHSPYKNINNSPQPFLPNALSPASKPRAEFVDLSQDIWGVHTAYLRRVVDEVGGIGNLIFEIMNEGRSVDWPDTDSDMKSEVEEWQIQVAAQLRANLPTAVVRDAFNAEVDNTALNGKAADSGQTWTATNAKVKLLASAARYTQARVVPQGTSGVPSMSGSLPINLSGQKRASVAGDLSRTAGFVRVGFQNTGGSLVAEYNGTSVILRSISSGGIVTTLGTYTPSPAVTSPHVRLVIDLVAGNASVVVNSDPVLNNITVPGGIPLYNKALLEGSIGSGTYTETQGSVDNFEVATYNIQ